MSPDYTLEDLTPEEMQSLTEELQAVLAKYSCEMAVRSEIEIMKRKPITQDDTTTNQENTSEEASEIHETTDSVQA